METEPAPPTTPPALAVPKTFAELALFGWSIIPPVDLNSDEEALSAVAIEPQHFAEGTFRHAFIAVSRRAIIT